MLDNTLRQIIALGLSDKELLGLSDKELNDDDLDRELDLATLKSMVDNLLGGRDRIIGERGIKLSGG